MLNIDSDLYAPSPSVGGCATVPGAPGDVNVKLNAPVLFTTCTGVCPRVSPPAKSPITNKPAAIESTIPCRTLVCFMTHSPAPNLSTFQLSTFNFQLPINSTPVHST